MNRLNAPDRTDEEIVLRFQTEPEADGVRRDVADLFARYQGRVYLWCVRHVRDHERALDLAQETLLAAYRDLGTFEGRARFSSWLFAIARNRCLSQLRRPALMTDEHADPDAVMDDGIGPDRELEERLDEEASLALIRRTLEPVEQEAIWLRCFERVAVDDITVILKIGSASGARGVLQSARRKLRSALAARARDDDAHRWGSSP